MYTKFNEFLLKICCINATIYFKMAKKHSFLSFTGQILLKTHHYCLNNNINKRKHNEQNS